MKGKTPQISKRISRWCKKISPNGSLHYVKVTPEYQAGFCHMASADRNLRDRSLEIVHGWMIWESKLLLEAENHCIIRNPDGSLSDHTKTSDGERTILFLEDNSLSIYLKGEDCIGYDNIIFPDHKKTYVKRRYLFGSSINGSISKKFTIDDESRILFDSLIDIIKR